MGLILLMLVYLALAAAVAAVATRLGRTPSWWAALALTLLPLAFTAHGFLPGLTLAPTGLMTGVPPWADPGRWVVMEAEPVSNPLLLDPISQFIPWSRAARDGLLYNPAQGGGAALLGNGQSAVLYPTEVVSRALPPFRAATFSQAARLLVAGWGMYLLAGALLGMAAGRRLPGMGVTGVTAVTGELAALAAAVVYVGCGFVQLWRLHPHTLVAATVPWIAFALVWLVRRPGPRPAVTLAVAGAVAVAGGHPETLLHGLLFALLAAAAVWGVERVGEGGGESASGKMPVGGVLPIFLHGGAAALLAALLAAPVLLPFLENLPVSHEWELRRDAGTVVEVPLAEAVTRLRPGFALHALGDPVAGDWEGPENLAELGGASVGTGALVLGLLALVAGSRRRRWLAAGLLLVGLLGLAVSVHLPLVSRPFGEVPLLRESLLKRLSLWWALALSLAAALGMAGWLEGSRRDRVGKRLPVGIAGAALLVAALVAWAGGGRPAAAGWELGTLAVVLVLLLTPLLLAPPRRTVAAVATGLLFAALLVPRAALLSTWIPAVSAAGFYADTPATGYVAQRLAASDEGWRVAGLRGALLPQSAAFFGFSEVRAYDPMTFAPYHRFLGLVGETPEVGWTDVRDPASPALAFLGARFLFENAQEEGRPGVEVAFRGTGALVYENPNALPRAFVPPRVEVVGSAEEALAAAGEVEDFSRRVLVSGLDVGPLRVGERRVLPSGPARVEELRVEPGRLTLTVEAEEPALVATSQPAIPGWGVRLDGAAAEPVRVNGAFVGVVVEPGRHEVEMVYAPAGWRWGLGLFAVGLLPAVGWLLLDLRWREEAA